MNYTKCETLNLIGGVGKRVANDHIVDIATKNKNNQSGKIFKYYNSTI